MKVSTSPWTRLQLQRALKRGPHKSYHDHLPFLHNEFVDMIAKGQQVVLPYSAVQHLPGLRLSPQGSGAATGKAPMPHL